MAIIKLPVAFVTKINRSIDWFVGNKMLIQKV